MEQQKPAPVVMPADAIEPGTVALWCAGCDAHHLVGPGWTRTGDAERPTFSPSLLVRWRNAEGQAEATCHSFVRDGRIEYLGDCTHALAGQNVRLTPVAEWPRRLSFVRT